MDEDLVYIHLRDLLKSEWRFSFNIYNMDGKSQTFHKWFPYMFIYMLTRALLIQNTCWPSSFVKTNLISGNLIFFKSP